MSRQGCRKAASGTRANEDAGPGSRPTRAGTGRRRRQDQHILPSQGPAREGKTPHSPAHHWKARSRQPSPYYLQWGAGQARHQACGRGHWGCLHRNVHLSIKEKATGPWQDHCPRPPQRVPVGFLALTNGNCWDADVKQTLNTGRAVHS